MLESHVVGKYLSQQQISSQPRCPAPPPRNYTLITLSTTAITHLHRQLVVCSQQVCASKLASHSMHVVDWCTGMQDLLSVHCFLFVPQSKAGWSLTNWIIWVSPGTGARVFMREKGKGTDLTQKTSHLIPTPNLFPSNKMKSILKKNPIKVELISHQKN